MQVYDFASDIIKHSFSFFLRAVDGEKSSEVYGSWVCHAVFPSSSWYGNKGTRDVYTRFDLGILSKAVDCQKGNR